MNGFIVVRHRKVRLPDARDVACVRRALAAQSAETDRSAQLALIARALPVLLDLLADGRCDLPLEKLAFSSLELTEKIEAPGTHANALAFYRVGSFRAEVRFVSSGNETCARVTFTVDPQVASVDEAVLIRRFKHGGGPGNP